MSSSSSPPSSFSRMLTTGEMERNLHPTLESWRRRSALRNDDDEVEEFFETALSVSSFQDSHGPCRRRTQSLDTSTTAKPCSNRSLYHEDDNDIVGATACCSGSHSYCRGGRLTAANLSDRNNIQRERRIHRLHCLKDCELEVNIRLPVTKEKLSISTESFTSVGCIDEEFMEEESKSQDFNPRQHENPVIALVNNDGVNDCDYNIDDYEVVTNEGTAICRTNRRVPVVSATEFDDVDFWSMDGETEEPNRWWCCRCCRRRPKLTILLLVIVFCVVAVWLCIEYFSVPGNAISGGGPTGSNRDDTRDFYSEIEFSSFHPP